MSIELESLAGEHILTHASLDAITKTEYGSTDTCMVVRFTLDDVNYEATEGPNDGYRSSLGDLSVSETQPARLSKETRVICQMKPKEGDAKDDDVLQILNADTKRAIIEIGTTDASDYYPGFVGYFSPENL